MALVIALALPAAAAAEQVVAGLSQTSVSITASFVGSEILIFGAVRREEPIPRDGQLEVVITVEGPPEPVTVWRKARRFGIWVNVEAVQVSRAPTFYAIASTSPLGEVLSATEDLRHRISVPLAIRAIGARATIPDPPSFTKALIRIRENGGLYQSMEGGVEFEQSTLFNTRIILPANLTEGRYATRIFLTRNGAVLDVHESVIDVQKVGLERWLFNLAHEQPLIYGLLSLVMAIGAGWGASAAFRYFRV